jgi:hypothetical protein
MYVLKGFVANALFANNNPGTVATFGELSTQSSTYTNSMGVYVASDVANLTLNTFLSATDGVTTALDATLKEQVLTIAQWLYTKSINTAGQLDADDLLTQLLTGFSSVASSFASGSMVNNGTYYMPEWISFTYNALSGSFIKIWFCDASFQTQYDEYNITVVPPFSALDAVFFGGASVVKADAAASTWKTQTETIQTARNGNPETSLVGMTYDYVDPTDSTNLIPTNWATLIYGTVGDNIDSIKSALQTYILANSTHTQSEWTAILPDIFKTTEFILVPRYDQYAIADRAIEAGVYSPITNIAAGIAEIAKYAFPASTYPSAHINSYACDMGHPYKSLNILSIGSNQNQNNQYQLTQLFADFIAVSTSSTDFSRMSTTTQAWAELLSELLIAAETATAYSSLPTGMTRLTRNGILYVVADYNNIQYLVVAKSNFSS